MLCGAEVITGLNHITLAVSDLPRSVSFYRDFLGCALVSLHENGAYLSVGGLWLCLSLDPAAATQDRSDYTHFAFSVPTAEFEEFERRILESGVPIWKEDRSEGRSVYFLDPDNHKLEAHVGTLESRLVSMRSSTDRKIDGSGCAE